QRLEVELPLHPTRDQAFQLRREHQPPSLDGEMERLDAEPVAPEDQPPGALVPQGEREHTAQVADEVDSVLLVEMHQHLDVAARPEEVPPRAETRGQLAIVVDLAVAHD